MKLSDTFYYEKVLYFYLFVWKLSFESVLDIFISRKFGTAVSEIDSNQEYQALSQPFPASGLSFPTADWQVPGSISYFLQLNKLSWSIDITNCVGIASL